MRRRARVPLAVVLDRAGSLEILEQDRLDVQVELDLVADDDAAAGDVVLPGDTEVVAVDLGGGLEADAPELALVLVADPEGGLPFAEGDDVERDGPGHAANREVDRAGERGAAGALGEPAGECDLRVVLHVEEVCAAQMLVALRLAGPDSRRVYLSLEGRVETVIPVELETTVDVFEQTAHPGDHHVPGAKLGLRVSGLKDPSGHQLSSLIVSAPVAVFPRRSRRDGRHRR
jgi:hypothetical protein